LYVQRNLTIKGAEGAFGLYRQSGGTAHIHGDLVNNDWMILRGGAMTVDGELINNGHCEVSGTATLTTSADTFVNSGRVTIQGDGMKTINGPMKNLAEVHVGHTTVTFSDTLTNLGALTSSDSAIGLGHLVVGEEGYIAGGAGDRYAIVGDFENGSLQSSLWDTRAAALVFAGSDAHVCTLAGVDLGLDPLGFQDNFAWGELSLALGETLTLLDGNATPGAALYVGLLTLQDVQQLESITSDFNVYYDRRLPGNEYLGGLTYNLNGSGRLMGAVPEPGSWVLMLCGFLGLAVWMRGRKR
jgi:hypothetical protein